MTENMMNSAHKASNELSRAGWDRTFGSVFHLPGKKDKLRLLLFEKCNRKCVGCVNNNHDLDDLPVVKNFRGYKQVILTGGEPMLDPRLVAEVALKVKDQNPNCDVILYTAKTDSMRDMLQVWTLLDGITVTLHTDYDYRPFKIMAGIVKGKHWKRISLRLNVVSTVMKRMSWEQVRWLKKSGWTVKSMPWKKDCPLPEGEVFKRLNAPKPKLKLPFGGLWYGNNS